MREIGGYIELERYQLPMLHEEAIRLNCGRNCLAYLIEAKKITKIILPYFLCDSVKNLCLSYQVEVKFYHIDKFFLPVELLLDQDEWLYLVNYYGQISAKKVKELACKYKNLIVDYAQAYFEKPVEGIDSLYSCRKFFGVADGAFLYTDKIMEEDFDYDESHERMKFILGRFEKPASEFYQDYVKNNQIFSKEPIKKMSKLTQNLLHGIDYKWVKNKRTENYMYLFKQLKNMNQLQLKEIEGAFAYPLMIDNASIIRKNMIKQGIYIPTLWPNVLRDVDRDSQDYQLANNILPLPCDQRYGYNEMEIICKILFEEINRVTC